jgi:plastocyanin
MRFLILIFASLLIGCVPAPTPTNTPIPPTPTPTVMPTVAPTNTPTNTPTPTPTKVAVGAPKTIVQIEAWDDYFRPQTVIVTVGTQVTWTNLGKNDHTVTLGKLFDGDLKVGQSFSYTFDKPGTYEYYCVVHAESETVGMVGIVTVLPATSAATNSPTGIFKGDSAKGLLTLK